jgi:hypothetical protein
MGGDDGRIGGHDQECTPRNSLKVAAETENETRDKVYDARGVYLFHVLQVYYYRDFLAVVLTHGGGVSKVSRTHDCNMDAVTHGKLAAREFVVIGHLAEALGSVPVVTVVVGSGAIIMLGETEPITGIALHYADLHRYEPIRGRPSGEITVED